MNPCVDCRAMMFEAAKERMEEVGAEFIISGEVLGQRPMSQHRDAMRIIEKDSGLRGKIVRPLSGALLDPTDAERSGLIRREDLGMVRGRSRKPQLRMAREYGIANPPNAGGGCLLTDKAFGRRAKDLFAHTETPTINDIELLKVGRHFRLGDGARMIVGRDKAENETIQALALPGDIVMEDAENVGPVTLVRGPDAAAHTAFCAAVTLRYSDSEAGREGSVAMSGAAGGTLRAVPAEPDECSRAML
ncbi:MAG: tRNA (5-methylaminomethyl-2-thiouridylate)-methyltransferase [Thaumarchaeota archaeon]|nr:tRNA (5-methylaminomethyl-2-thiouridylate)-methyltransferase [Nitrososphaerota archaeon]